MGFYVTTVVLDEQRIKAGLSAVQGRLPPVINVANPQHRLCTVFVK